MMIRGSSFRKFDLQAMGAKMEMYNDWHFMAYSGLMAEIGV